MSIKTSPEETIRLVASDLDDMANRLQQVLAGEVPGPANQEAVLQGIRGQLSMWARGLRAMGLNSGGVRSSAEIRAERDKCADLVNAGTSLSAEIVWQILGWVLREHDDAPYDGFVKDNRL